MTEKMRILFVDDEPRVVDGLQRMLHTTRDEWDLEFATSGQEAVELMAKRPFDVIVSDMRMPRMNGAQLLEYVQKVYPHMVRLILSGYSDRELILNSVGPTHQFLTKPCDADKLIDAVRRSCALRDQLTSPRLRQIVAQIGSLPVLPTVYTELVQALSKDDVAMQDIGQIIAKDVSMMANILQVINSAYFGLRQPVQDPSRAVFDLGLDTVKGLVMRMIVFSEFETAGVSEFSIMALHQHCLRVGTTARRLAVETDMPPQLQNEAFTAGVLHGVGRLILIANFREEFRKALALSRDRNIRLTAAEQEILGTTHGALAGYLLALWGMSDSIVEAVALHTNPKASPNRSRGALTLVHAANCIDRELSREELPGGGFGYDMEYLSELGVAEQLPRWREIASSVEPQTSTVLAGVADAC